MIAEEILWNHFATVFRDAAFSRPDIMATNACQNFANRVYSCLLASAAAQSGPQKSISVDEKQERENSRRKGRENLPRTAPIGAHKQPADQSQELRRNGENQPATRTQEPDPPMVLQAMPSDHPKVIGPSPLEKGPSRKPCSPSSVDKDGVVVGPPGQTANDQDVRTWPSHVFAGYAKCSPEGHWPLPPRKQPWLALLSWQCQQFASRFGE